jgi:calcineurin-like phosphoesterase family protein
VTDSDVVIHCGDLCAGKWEDCKSIMNDLPGYKILVKGNHDGAKNDRYLEVFNEVYDIAYIHEDIVYSHVPVDVTNFNTTYNIFGHFHVYPIGKDISKIRRYKTYYNFNVHFPICIWDWDWKLPSLNDFKIRFIK